MVHEYFVHKQETERAPDDARKFVVRSIDQSLLEGDDVSRCHFPTDWLETDEDTEKKIVRKTYTDGNVEMLLIAKVTESGKRSSDKKALTQEEYGELLKSSKLRIEKDRYTFAMQQHEVTFTMNYDVFAESDLRILEVDADEEHSRKLFDMEAFPGILEEVPAGDRSYEGYRVAQHL